MTHKIVIADDEPNILISLEYLLKREGFDVRAGPHDGHRGARGRYAAERAGDLLLLDVMMPRKSGFDVCQADPRRRAPAGGARRS